MPNTIPYSHFYSVLDELDNVRYRIDSLRAMQADRERQRRRGSPFPDSENRYALQGLQRLSLLEREIKKNTNCVVEYSSEGNSYLSGYAQHLKNKKGLYEFIEDKPLRRFDKTNFRTHFLAIRALRYPASCVYRQARLYGAHELARVARSTIKNARNDMRECISESSHGYMVVRWVHGIRLEFHLFILPGKSLVTAWNEVRDYFRMNIQRMRSDQREENADPLSYKSANYHLQKSALKMLRTSKKPSENVRSVGIEIECLIPRTADMTKLYPVAQYVNVGHDGSIRSDDRDFSGVEFRVCAPAFQMKEVVTQLCAILKDMGAKVNTSCGLHVHLDQRNRSEDEIKQIFANFIRAQNLLFEVVPKSRRDNHFCKKHRGTDFYAAERGNRYKAVNAVSYRKHKTLEIRLFGGTVNAEKIINWVKTLWAIESGQPVLRCPKTFDIARRYWALDPSTLEWLKMRQEKFKDVPRDNTDVMDVEHTTPIEEGE